MKHIDNKESNLLYNPNSYKFRRTDKRTLVKKQGKVSAKSETGIVIASAGRYYIVEKEKDYFISCTTAGAIISKNDDSSLIAIGDEVCYIENKKEKSDEKTGQIIKVFPRRNCFSRQTVGAFNKEDVIASNIDMVLILMSVADPIYNRRLLDRLFVTAELNLIEPIICINKIDLIDIETIHSDFEIYTKLGLKLFFISAKKNIGIDLLVEEISGSISLIIGQSGVGKSTLLNQIVGVGIQKVNEIAEKTGKGKHTTSFVKMFDLKNGGKLIDSPGIREFGMWGLEADELHLYFKDFEESAKQCRFNPCTHIHEPGCAVIVGLENETIDLQRYESYINMYESIKNK